MRRSQWTPLPIALFWLLVSPVVSLGQSSQSEATDQTAPSSKKQETEAPGRSGKAGYEDRETFGGPRSVARELVEQDQVDDYRFDLLHRWLKPYFDWKADLDDRYGLTLGLNATLLYQYADGGHLEDNDAAGGIYRFQGSWNAIGRETGHSGSLGFRFEYRSKIGSLGPSGLSSNLGIGALNTGFAYADQFGADLAVLDWTQFFNDNRLALVFGRLDFAAFLDPYPYQTFSRGFLNRAFVVNPSTAVTGVGALGIGMKGFVGENVWLGGFAYDANAVSGEFDIGTLTTDELFTHFEIGWTPSYECRKTDKILFTFWHKDDRIDASAPGGEGWLLTANWQIADRYLPFLRWGSSDGGGGAPAKEALSVGVGISPGRDELSLGVGWSKPSELTFGPDFDDEYVIEVSYRLQMSPNLTLMPDLQLVLDPVNNPDESQVWVASLRARWDI